MCGIAGIYRPQGFDSDRLEDALEAIRHRGPDDSGHFREQGVAIGMRRLSILDIEGGHQPIWNEDRSLAAVLNGEIYNFVELREQLKSRGHQFRTSTDSEVLVHLYEEHGPSLCEHLRGMFAFAIWDRRQQQLLLARDRFGKKPLYYTHDPDGGILFASELKALRPLMEAARIACEINPQAIYDYLSLGSIPQPTTIFQGVSVLPAGSWLTCDGKRSNMQSYWRFAFANSRQKISYDEALVKTRDVVADAVRVRLQSDVPLGVFLSAGVDSSIIAYEASRVVGSSLQSFTVGVEDRSLDESTVAARTAKSLGIQNIVLPLTIAPLEIVEQLAGVYDQPFADSSAIPSLAVSRLAREHVTVVLNGDGGDEVFSGYRRHQAIRWAGLERVVPAFLASRLSRLLLQASAKKRRSSLGFGSRFLRGLCRQPGARYLIWGSDLLLEEDKLEIWKGPQLRSTEEWVESLLPTSVSHLDIQATADVEINLLSDLLVKMDMANMAYSLEGRSPLLDHNVAEFVASLPSSYRLHRGLSKSLLRDAYRGRLPDEVIRAPKKGFEIPMKTWLKNDLRTILMDTLGSSTALTKQYVDGSFIDNLLAERIMPERNWAGLVFGLLMLELWLQEFSEKNPHERST